MTPQQHIDTTLTEAWQRYKAGQCPFSEVQAAQDNERRARFGEAGRCRFDEHFSMAGMMRAYRNCYTELLASG